jgi:hypothetical protein
MGLMTESESHAEEAERGDATDNDNALRIKVKVVCWKRFWTGVTLKRPLYRLKGIRAPLVLMVCNGMNCVHISQSNGKPYVKVFWKATTIQALCGKLK